MKTLEPDLGRMHLVTFGVLLGAFTILTFLITSSGIDDGPEHNRQVLLTTAGTLTGPLTGAIARDFQGCCLRFSLWLVLWCSPVLLLGLVSQFILPVTCRRHRVIRMVLWISGWTVWFMGGIASFGHALS